MIAEASEMILNNPGAEAAVAVMSEGERLEIGRKTYRFVRRLMRDPEIRAKILARAAQIRAEEQIDTFQAETEG